MKHNKKIFFLIISLIYLLNINFSYGFEIKHIVTVSNISVDSIDTVLIKDSNSNLYLSPFHSAASKFHLFRMYKFDPSFTKIKGTQYYFDYETGLTPNYVSVHAPAVYLNGYIYIAVTEGVSYTNKNTGSTSSVNIPYILKIDASTLNVVDYRRINVLNITDYTPPSGDAIVAARGIVTDGQYLYVVFRRLNKFAILKLDQNLNRIWAKDYQIYYTDIYIIGSAIEQIFYDSVHDYLIVTGYDGARIVIINAQDGSLIKALQVEYYRSSYLNWYSILNTPYTPIMYNIHNGKLYILGHGYITSSTNPQLIFAVVNLDNFSLEAEKAILSIDEPAFGVTFNYFAASEVDIIDNSLVLFFNSRVAGGIERATFATLDSNYNLVDMYYDIASLSNVPGLFVNNIYYFINNNNDFIKYNPSEIQTDTCTPSTTIYAPIKAEATSIFTDLLASGKARIVDLTATYPNSVQDAILGYDDNSSPIPLDYNEITPGNIITTDITDQWYFVDPSTVICQDIPLLSCSAQQLIFNESYMTEKLYCTSPSTIDLVNISDLNFKIISDNCTNNSGDCSIIIEATPNVLAPIESTLNINSASDSLSINLKFIPDKDKTNTPVICTKGKMDLQPEPTKTFIILYQQGDCVWTEKENN